MVCPFCLHKKTTVYNSRSGSRLNVIWRRRRCANCDAQFTTYESADPSSVLLVRKGKEITAFSHTKLVIDLLKACDHRDDLDESTPYLAGTIEQKLYRLASQAKEPTVTTDQIFNTTSDTLQHYDPVAYVKYIGTRQKNLTAPTLRQALKKKS